MRLLDDAQSSLFQIHRREAEMQPSLLSKIIVAAT